MKTPKYMNQTLLLLSVGVAVIAAFVLIFIMPSQKAMAKLDLEISKTKFKIDTHEKLGPLYKGLEEKLKKIDRQATLPAAQPIAKSQLNSFSGAVSGMARKDNLSVLSVYPETMSPESGSTVYNLNLRGNFLDFRNFLKDLGKLPYVDAVQEIKIITGKGSREFTVKIKLLVA